MCTVLELALHLLERFLTSITNANKNLHAAFQRDGVHALNVLRQCHFANVHARLCDPLVVAIKAIVFFKPCNPYTLTLSLCDGSVEYLERREGRAMVGRVKVRAYSMQPYCISLFRMT